MSLSFSMFFLDFYFTKRRLLWTAKHEVPQAICFSVWSSATQPLNQLKHRGIQKQWDT